MTPHLEAMSASVIGAAMGVASAVVQAAQPATIVLHPFVVPAVSAVIGGVVSFVALRTTVATMREDLHDIKQDHKDIATRLARIEGKLEAEP